MPRVVSRDYGTSLRFNGTGSTYVNVRNGSPILGTLQNWTVMGWIKGLSPGSDPLYSERAASGNDILKVETANYNSGGAIRVILRDDSGNLSSFVALTNVQMTNGVWYHVAVTRNGNILKAYLNGENRTNQNTISASVTNAFTNTGIQCRIGADAGDLSAGFEGWIDEVRIFNVTLTDDEISKQYSQGGAAVTRGIVGSWNFDEGSGTTTADTSPSGYTGTVSGATWTTDVPFKSRMVDSSRIAPRTGRAALVYRGGQQAVVSGVTSQMNSAYTMSIWARRGKIDNNAQAMIRDTVGDKMWFNFDGSGSNSIRVYHQDLSPANTNTALRIADNAWHHYVATYNGSQINIYVDGVLRATNNVTGTLSMSGQFNVGGVTNFSGMIRAVHVYNRALTLAEIRQAYFGNLYPTTNRILVWPTNEGTGLTLYDSSGNGNNGTMSADLTWTIDTPIGQRALISPNLVNNGDFSYIPPVNVPQTGTGYVDGSTGGSTTQQFGGWYVTGSGSGKSAQFDSTTQYNGLNSFKLSTTATGSYIESRSNGANDYFPPGKGFRLQPSTTYTLSYAIKTNVTSGTSNDGAYVDICLYNYNGGSASEVATTKVKVTQDWTTYTMNFTTSAVQTLGHVEPRIYGHTGSANLIMDAWFANIQVTPQTPISRQTIV